MDIIPVNIKANLDLCVVFRKDAYCISYGTEAGFNEQDTIKSFSSLEEENADGFKHVLINNEIVGQLEFKSRIASSDGIMRGYVCLFYLIKKYRRRGFGQRIHDYVMAQFLKDTCKEVHLRYIPGNLGAENFYFKNNWLLVGEPDNRGQLMIKNLA